jgi:hypothetical protein
MKAIKLLLLTFVIVISVKSVSAQSVQDVFNKKEMTWYGLDFSMAKFAGDFSQFNTTGVQTGSQIRDVYFRSWNNVVISEKEKYNFQVFFKKESVLVDLSSVDVLNNKVNSDSIIALAAPKPLSEAKIQEEVSKYDNKGKSGMGLVFIIESFDKISGLGTIHVTFFDIVSGKVLLTKRLQMQPKGFGLRNYWVSTAYAAMVQSKDKWKTWKKEAGVK